MGLICVRQFCLSVLLICVLCPIQVLQAAPAHNTQTMQERDPWEGFNRGVFAFNETADYYFMKPVAVSYKWVMPTVAFNGVNNFFSNITELPSTANALMQAKPKNAGITVARFCINLTVGFFGIFDVATQLGIEQEKEDFGQTMAVWGIPSGPYVMVPFLGPKTVRDGTGMVVDLKLDPVYVENVRARNTMYAVKFTALRADLLEAESLISGDRYEFIREAYLQNREYKIHDGNIIDYFGEDDLDDDDWLDDDEL